MRVRTNGFLGRLAASAQPGRSLVHVALSPRWARVLIAAGARRGDAPDSMSVNFSELGGREGANQPRDVDAATERSGDQGLLFGDTAGHSQEVGYRGPTASAVAGITYRQLDYWARTGLVEPSLRAAQGQGSARLYSARDILVLKVVQRLLDTGISLDQIRAAVSHLHDRGLKELTGVTLMSDGVNVFEASSSDEVVDLLESGHGVFGIALARIWREIDRDLVGVSSSEGGRSQSAG